MKKRHISVILCFAIISYLNLIPIQAEKKLLPDYKLTVNNQSIVLDTPIILENQTYYFPLRDLETALKAQTQYQRAADNYIFTIAPAFNVLIIPNSREFWVNDSQNFFSQPTFHNAGRIYVPINEFFRTLNYALEFKNNTFIAKKSPPPIKTEPLKNQSNNATNLGTLRSQIADTYPLPVLEKNEALHLEFNNKICNLKGNYFYINDILFFNPNEFLLSEGYEQLVTGNDWIVIKPPTTYIFSSKYNTVTIIENQKKETRFLPYPIIIKNQQIFLPLQAFLNAFNLGAHWNAKTKTLHLLSIIDQIQINKINDSYKLKIISSGQIHPSQPIPIQWHKGFYIDIPNSICAINKNAVYLENSPISVFSADQIAADTTRLFILLRKSAPYSKLTPTHFGAELSFYPKVIDIKEQIYEQSIQVVIIADSPFTPTFNLLPDPPRLIIDIPNTMSELPLIIRSDQAVYKRIRTALFQNDPPSTRIVFDLFGPTNFSNKWLNPQTLELTFPINRQLRIIEPKVVKVKDKSPPVLDNIVIALDPGHGGNDVGAIAPNGDYEKNYTIEIATQLKKRLEESGAFVIMLREGDENPSLYERVYKANRNKADILVSIHLNAFFRSYANGTETFYYKYKDKNLAQYLHHETLQSLKLKNNGLKRARMYVLRHSNMPAVLVEPAYMTHPEEGVLLNRASYRNQITETLYQGILKYFEHFNPKKTAKAKRR